ncbi:disulfide bond formation protein B [Helicobacter sp.]|uniref:disulfide bond formation protein B n=1 Tax=Helicobacter sp. TaxID=218 RepID=UPI0025C71E25|nr:disulfide bond formation protein B [Helicobacter sp.]MCI5968594.1 disulfide bond formation protein B [Helicobacter sp.]MDY2584417.1 disulfide bond formation protein B [Helicobacter sp.]
MQNPKSFLEILSFSQKRCVWIAFAVFAFLIVAFSHFVLQEYLFLQPCEQCVYIRYAFIVLGLGCCVIALSPRSIFGLFGIFICAYALARGVLAAFMLKGIQNALQSETFVFGLKGCSLNPKFDFNLPLDVWIPTLFAPSGFCGMDLPMLNRIQMLSPMQEWFVALYADGWYLIPTLKFGTMAECALFIFVVYGVGIGILFLTNFYKKSNKI